jgi:hypothetical protein
VDFKNSASVWGKSNLRWVTKTEAVLFLSVLLQPTPQKNGRFPPSFLPIPKALQHSEHEKKVAKVEQEGKGSTLNILP